MAGKIKQLTFSDGATVSAPTAIDVTGPTSTKGDLYTNTGSVAARQAVGADGLPLIGDSSQTNGLSYLRTDLLGDVKSTIVSQTYAVTSAAPGVFTVASTSSMLTGDRAYVTVTQNGFTANTTYYVVVINATTFKLATTKANAATSTCITSSGTTAGTVITGGMALAAGNPGVITGSAVTAGYVGETWSVSGTANLSAAGTAVATTACTKTIPPGIWLVWASAEITGTSIVSTQSIISVSSTNNGLGPAGNQASLTYTSGNFGDVTLATAPIVVNIAPGSAGTPYYCVCRCSFSGGSSITGAGNLYGVRIA